MSLEIGSLLGHYEVLSPLGAGAMGEVYRALDMRLQREVALKVLPDAFARNPERLARFQREAQLLAALNHPNIAAIYGIDEGALVMELVEGFTLAEHLQRGPMPPEQVLPLASQIAAALEAAHEKGIIHRDLKPGNIKITPDHVAKVLDFGLARLATNELTIAGSMLKPTLPVTRDLDSTQTGGDPAATRLGSVLGTASYMAPEQARGEHVDKRADIWSYGIVLYEMLVGRRPFSGANVAEILSNMMGTEPDWEPVPERFRPLIRRCLEKDPKRRLRDMGEARFALENEGYALAPRKPRSWTPWIALAAAVTGAGLMSVSSFGVRPAPTDGPLLSFGDVSGPPVDGQSGRAVVLSNDGTRVLYVSRGEDGVRRLVTRVLAQSKVVTLAGTEGAAYPFLSPDGRWTGFFAGGKLKKLPIQGGTVLSLCDAPNGRGGAWNEDDIIVAALNNRGGLSRLPAGGGVAPVPVTELRPGENCHRWPHFLPGGKVFVFTAGNAGGGTLVNTHLEAQRLEGGQRSQLRSGGIFVRALNERRLAWIEEGALQTAEFDAASLRFTSAPVSMPEQAQANIRTAEAMFATSPNGLLAYLPGRTPDALLDLKWLDARGVSEPALEQRGDYSGARLSPDGKRLAFTLTEGGSSQIWVYEFASRKATRLTFAEGLQESPVWSPNGARIAYRSGTGMAWVEGIGGTAQVLSTSRNSQYPQSFTPDGRRLLYEELDRVNSTDIGMLDVESRATTPVLATRFTEAGPVVSPDGRWLAYSSDETGRNQIYVQSLSQPGAKWQVSEEGGVYPVWAAKGGALYYMDERYLLMTASYRVTGSAFVADRPRPWSPKGMDSIGFTRGFDPSADGKRFLVISIPRQAAGVMPDRLMFHVNYVGEIARRQRAAKLP